MLVTVMSWATASDCEKVKWAIEQALVSWQTGWMSRQYECLVSTSLCDTISPPQLSGSGLVWCSSIINSPQLGDLRCWMSDDSMRIFSALLGLEGPGKVEGGAVRENVSVAAIADLIACISAPMSSGHASMTRGSGFPKMHGCPFIRLYFQFDEQGFELFIEKISPHVRRGLRDGMASGKLPIGILSELAAKERVELSVVLGAARLEIREIETLAVGDVVRLNTKLDGHLQVRAPTGELMARCVLGKQNEFKAVKLLA